VTEIQSLARGLMILNHMAESDSSLGVTELASLLEVDKSTASRLIKTLMAYDYVQPDPGSRRYVLGKKVVQLSWQVLNRLPLRDFVHPTLMRLMQQTGECSHVAVYSQKQVLVIEDVDSPAPLRVVSGAGRLIPMHCTALGKCLLAFAHIPLPPDLPMKTARTIIDRVNLQTELDRVRQQGYAVDDEENDIGVRCIAAPILDPSGEAAATVGISGPTVRVTRERIPALAALVVEAGKELSARLQETQTPP
jgi:IclR family transcriptional regulator, KDG regulon repressor